MGKCIGRRTFVSLRRRFGDGKHWVYGEAMCEKEAEGDLCDVCKARGVAKLQAQPGFPHGKCGEEIPANSQIYGGKWYKDRVGVWGEPAEEDLKFLEEASQSVMKTLDQYFGKKKDDDAIMEICGGAKKRGKKKESVAVAAVAAAVAAEAADAAPTAPAKKPRSRTKKREIVPMNAEKDISSGIIVAMEVEEEEVIPEEFEEIIIEPTVISGKEYYWEPVKQKVYKKAGDGGLGDYMGRLHDGKIVDGIPDSDEDCV